MKKKLLAACLAATMLGTSGMAAAEDINPFDDVPKDHWVYQEIAELAKDGLVEGYEDGTFRGGEEVTRYEMAALVGRAISNANHRGKDGITEAEYEALQKLGNEFHHELDAMGVRLSSLEKYKSNAGFFGDVRVRAMHNRMNKSIEGTKSEKRFDQRIRLGWWSEIAPNFTFKARMRADNVVDERREDAAGGEARYDSTGLVKVDLAEGKWTNGPLALAIGRFNPTIGQGGIWSSQGEGSVDGFYASYAPSSKTKISAGYGSVSPSMWDILYDYKGADGTAYKQSTDVYTPAFLGNISHQAGPVMLTFGVLRSLSGAEHTQLGYRTADGMGATPIDASYDMKQYAIGADVRIAKGVHLTGEWLTNRADRNVGNVYVDMPQARNGATAPASGAWSKQTVPTQRNGWWMRLSAGNYDAQKAHTFDASLYYLKLGNWAIDSHFAPHGLPVRGGNGLGLDGEKGWGIGFRYMLAPSVELSGSHFWVKPYDEGASGFHSYTNPWQIALNYSF
ncbi:MAG: S-layer homology domain-containing protein [Selenomonadaceae bacterium]|nr:S-layer homology domain-containing protein [Selenomonadaceae bacterium]